MRIAHLCLSAIYVDGHSYQHNELVAQNVRDGHEVTMIASTESFDLDQRLCNVGPGTYLGTDGAKVVRLGYRNIVHPAITRKVRAHPGVYDLLLDLAPDIIFFHGLTGWELFTVARYKRDFPRTSLFVDCHEDFNNSARSLVSRWGLHWLFYRTIARACARRFDRIFCVSLESIEFARDFYKLPIRLIEFLPLGGNILEHSQYGQVRSAERVRLGLDDSTVLFVQTGKIDANKLLGRTLASFRKVACANARLIIAGHLHAEVREDLLRLISRDFRVAFVGWLDAAEMNALLCAADVYVQPGSQSATMQSAICSRCAVILADVPSHAPFIDGNGWLVRTEADLLDALVAASVSRAGVARMSQASAAIASSKLAYSDIAKRIYDRHLARLSPPPEH